MQNLSLKDFYAKRNKVLFRHGHGGIGDVFMHRMLFSPILKFFPDCEIHFSCIKNFGDALKDHPAKIKILNENEISDGEYLAVYRTSVANANRYENKEGKNCKHHRSDIWAYIAGFQLENHDMNFELDQKLVQNMRQKLEKLKKYDDKPIVLFNPIGSVPSKSLLPNQIDLIVKKTKEINLVGIHQTEIKQLKINKIETISGLDVENWIHCIAASDAVISVDTGTFHLAGGLKKPLLGIFTFANGKVYGKYFDFILVQKHFENGDWECGPCYAYGSCPKTNKEIKPCLSELTEKELDDGLQHFLQKITKNKVELPMFLFC